MFQGFVQFQDRLVLLGVQPIRDDLGSGLPRGMAVIGRYFDHGAQAALADEMETSFRIVGRDHLDPQIPWAFRIQPDQISVQGLWGPQVLRSQEAAEPTLAWAQVPRGAGDELYLEISIPPDLLTQERRFFQTQRSDQADFTSLTVLGILLTNLVLALVYLVITHRTILRRVAAIDRYARQVVLYPDRPRTLDLHGRDELTQIGHSIQSMVLIIEERKASVEERNRQLLALNEQLFISQAALRSSFIPMVLTDSKGIITKVNPAFLEFYGMIEAEVIGQEPQILNPGKTEYWNHGITEEHYQGLFSQLWADIRNPAIGRWEGTLFNKTKTGEVIPVQVVISAIQMSPEEVIGYIAWTISLSKPHKAERRILIEAFSALSELAEQRDNDTGLHQKRIGLMAAALARHLGLSRKFVHDIEVSAPLHDIGKVGIKDEILLAPRRLTTEEVSVMRNHALIGFEVLNKQPTMQMAAQIALSHHEWWDGTGYPYGTQGEAIPLAARIVAIVDVYDALRNRRPYKNPWTHRQTLDHLTAHRGIQFDPKLVDLFLAHEVEFEVISGLVEEKKP